jgi:hypothetical protein
MGLSNFFSTGGSKSKSSSYRPKQGQWLDQAIDLYGSQLGQNTNVYQGDRVAGLTGLQSGALGGAKNFLSAFSTPRGEAETPLFGETGEALKGLLSGQSGATGITPAQTERYFKESISDPTMYAMRNDILPSVDSSFAGGAFFGSGRSKAREKVLGDTARNLMEQRSTLGWNTLQQNQALEEAKAGRAQQAVNQGMHYSQQPAEQTMNNLRIAASQVSGLNDLLGIGSAEQTQEQKEIEASIAKFTEENQITDPTNLAILMSLIGQGMSSSTATSKGKGLGFDAASDFFGSLGKGASGELGTFVQRLRG